MSIVKVADSTDVINQCTENKCISAYESDVPNYLIMNYMIIYRQTSFQKL